MNISAASLSTNRFNDRTEVDPNSELKRRIYEAWLVYMDADSDAKSDAAYGVWAGLIEQLREVELVMWG